MKHYHVFADDPNWLHSYVRVWVLPEHYWEIVIGYGDGQQRTWVH